MKDEDIRAFNTVLDYFTKILLQVREDTKALREAQTIERSKTNQELRRLREKVACLVADRKAYAKVARELAKYNEPNRHETNIKKKRNW